MRSVFSDGISAVLVANTADYLAFVTKRALISSWPGRLSTFSRYCIRIGRWCVLGVAKRGFFRFVSSSFTMPFRMLRYFTSGESHGEALVGFISGLPARSEEHTSE